MLSKRDRQIAQTFRQRLEAVTPLRDMQVYGSRARGDAEPESDLDVFIEVADLTSELRQRISEIAWEVGFEMDRVISTFVVTREQLEHSAVGANPLVLNVMREGVRPYKRSETPSALSMPSKPIWNSRDGWDPYAARQ